MDTFGLCFKSIVVAVDFIDKPRLLSFRVSDIDAKAARMKQQVKLGSGAGSAQGDTLMLRTVAAAVSQLMLSTATLPTGSCRRHKLIIYFKADSMIYTSSSIRLLL